MSETVNPLADTIIGLYERHARAFDADRNRSLFEKVWLDRFTALLPVGGAILDIGCGSGEPIARDLIRRGFALTGIDSSPTLISLCQQRFPEWNWCIGDMRKLALEQIFDGLIAWDSMVHLAHEDQRRMFPIFGANAAPGGALLFTAGPAHGEAIGSYRGEPLYHASLAEDEYRSLLDENGFAVVKHLAEDPDCSGHTVWLARRT
ncbi:MAG: class I SAM-dependent methyltransferase [Xanthobacteraceae bacterium]